MTITGTSGDDDLQGTSGDDYFDVGQGGNDVAHGGGGNDGFDFGDTLTPADRVFGGSGFDALVLGAGDSTDVTFAADSMKSIEIIYPAEFASYRFVFDDANVAAGKRMIIAAGNSDGSNFLTVDASAESDGGWFDLEGSSSADTLITGNGNDIINAGGGDDYVNPGAGKDTVTGLGGNDHFVFENAGFDASDRIDGGDGTNTLTIGGDYSGGLTFGRHTIANIYQVELAAGNDWVVDMGRLELAPGGYMIVNGYVLGPSNTLHLDASRMPELTAVLDVSGGPSDDAILGSNGRDRLIGGFGADALTGNNGPDIYAFRTPTESTGPIYDTIFGFDAHGESIELWFGGVSALDPKVNHGRLGTTNFNTQLAAAVGADELAAFHAVLFAPDDGSLAGELFLIVNADGVAGYQANADLVVHLESARHMGDFSAANFGT
jgi:Ca2+-binding RTX toxin-like protein